MTETRLFGVWAVVGFVRPLVGLSSNCGVFAFISMCCKLPTGDVIYCAALCSCSRDCVESVKICGFKEQQVFIFRTVTGGEMCNLSGQNEIMEGNAFMVG